MGEPAGSGLALGEDQRGDMDEEQPTLERAGRSPSLLGHAESHDKRGPGARPERQPRSAGGPGPRWPARPGEPQHEAAADTGEVLRSLRECIEASSLSERGIRLPVDAYEETLLQSGLSGAWAEIEDAIEQHEASTGQTVLEVELRNVPLDRQALGASHRPERPEQRSGEPDDSVFCVPHPMALGAWPSRPGESQVVWEEPRLAYAANGGHGTGSATTEETGSSDAKRDAGKLPRRPQRLCSSPRDSQQPMGSAAHGLPERLARRANREALKACGNSVVPQVVAAIGRAILEADEGEAQAEGGRA